MRDGLISVLLFSFLLFLFLGASVYVSTEKTDTKEYKQYAAIFWPQKSRLEIFYTVFQSGGQLVRYGITDFITVSASLSANYKDRLYDNGALFVFSPFIEGSCRIQDKTNFKVAKNT